MRDPKRSPLRLPPELELVFRLSRIEASSQDLHRAQTLLNGELQWDRVMHAASAHRVVPLVYSGLTKAGAASAFEAPMARFRRLKLATVGANLAKLTEFLRVCRAFEAEGVSTVTLKGFPLAQTLYGDVGRRQVGDLDVVVAPRGVSRAIEVLRDLGFRLFRQDVVETVGLKRIVRERSEWRLGSGKGVSVDLHWKILWGGTIEFPVDELLHASDTVPIAGVDVSVPRADLTLTLLLLHGWGHAWFRLRWLVDVAEMLERVPTADERCVLDRVHAAGAGVALQTAHWLMEGLWCRPVSPGLAAFASARPLDPRMTSHIATGLVETGAGPGARPRSLRGYLSTLRYRLLMGTSLSRRLRSFLRPGVSDWIFLPLPPRLYFLYFLLRPVRELSGALRLLFAVKPGRAQR